MKLVNFRLRRDTINGEIEVAGFVWDIHNAATYIGLNHNIEANQVELTWRIEPSQIRVEYPAPAFRLVFRDVNYLEVTPRDPEMPNNEDECLDSFSQVYVTQPMSELIELGVPWPPPPDEEEAFHLLFHFRGGQRVRVGCQQAEFQPLPLHP